MNPVLRKIGATLLLIAALVMLAASSVQSYKVYDDEEDDEFGILTFHRIDERRMVIDATFYGVDRRDDRLFSTYDRLAGAGKRACPT